MKLIKDKDVFVTSNENLISAYKEAGYVEAEEKKEAPPKPSTKKTN